MAERKRFWKGITMAIALFLMAVLCELWWQIDYLNKLHAIGYPVSFIQQRGDIASQIFIWPHVVVDLTFVICILWIWKLLPRAQAIAGKRKLWKSMFIAGMLFLISNIYLLKLENSCFDCVLSYGFPLPFFQHGGWGFKIFLWHGVVVDLISLFISSAGISWFWEQLSLRRTRKIAA